MLPWTMPLYLPVKVPLLFLISYVFPPYIGHSQVSVPSFRSPLTDDIIIRIYVKIINRCMFLKYGLMLYYCVLSIFFVRFSYFIRCFYVILFIILFFVVIFTYIILFFFYTPIFYFLHFIRNIFSIFYMVFSLVFYNFTHFAHVYITQDLIYIPKPLGISPYLV